MSFGFRSDQTLGLIQSIFRKFPEVKSAWIFGSRALARETKGSDIDLAIDAPKLSYEKFISLRRRLNDSLLQEVDLVHLNTLKNKDLGSEIQKNGRHIYPAPAKRQNRKQKPKKVFRGGR